MKSKNQILLENKIRKMVREKLLKESNNTISPLILDHIKTISRYCEWMLDPNRKNSNSDVTQFLKLLNQETKHIDNALSNSSD